MMKTTSTEYHLPRSLFTGCLCLLSLAWTASAAKLSVEDVRRESEKLFGKLQVVPMKIRIEDQHLGRLQKSYTNLAVYVPADIEEGGRLYPRVGLHLRGVSTFQPVDQKPNFTLKFNEFEEGQRFYGLRKVRLSNAMIDKTYLMELLAWQLFTAAGVAAPRVNFARVELNGRDLGVYVLIEGVTKDFLRLNFGTDEGNVYEGDEADLNERLEQDYGKRSRHQTDLQDLVMAMTESDPKKRFKLLQEAIDLNVFASYVAIEVLMNVWDGYSMRINNYRVFCNHETKKVFFIPHGLDRIFEDPTDPIMPEMKGLVTKALLETPETRKLYLKRLAELNTKLMVPEDLFKRLDDATEVIRPALAELGRDRSHYRSLFIFKKRVERRVEIVAEELPGLLRELNAGPSGN